METTQQEPQPFDDLPPARPDLRRIAACFVVCALAATAVFLVARSSKPEPTPKAITTSPTTTDSGESTPPAETEEATGRAASADTDEGFLCRMFAERMEGTGLCGSTWEPPRRRSKTSSREPDGSSGPAVSPAGWIVTSETLDGWEFGVAHPEDWDRMDSVDGLVVATKDERIAVSATGGPWTGQSVEESAPDYVSYLRADFAPDLEILDEGPLRLDGFDGYRIRYEGTAESGAFEGETWLLVHDGMLWMVLQMHEPGDESGQQLAGEVARTFQVAAAA